MVTRLKDSLLLVGDRDSARPDLQAAFSSGYHLLEADNVKQALMLLEQNRACIAAVVADLPQDEDIRLLSTACNTDGETALPLILLLNLSDMGPREELLFLMGATDVIYKPFPHAVILRRVQVVVDLYLHKWNLEKLVAEQSAAIRSTNQVMLDALSAIIEHRSTESGNHILRIRRFTKILLEEVARTCPEYGLDERIIDLIAGAAALHDIGKISIPDAILNKPARLTPEEFSTMKSHTRVGAEMLLNLAGMGDAEYLRYAYNICLYHHERWDGRGYPEGLRGDEIPICAQVVAIADVFDALTSPRVYKPALSHDVAINMILNGECGVFSPRLLACFKNVRSAFVSLAMAYSDGHSPKADNITLSLPGPVWKTHTLNTLQVAQVKYQTLLHYLDDTVLELDLDNKLFHMIYNPNPELDILLPAADGGGNLDDLQKSAVHPADLPVLERIQQSLGEEFFVRGLRRKQFRYRLYSPSAGDFIPYDLTLLRVNTGNDSQRILLAVWHRLESMDDGGRSTVREALNPEDLGCYLLTCRDDCTQTLIENKGELYALTGFTPDILRSRFGNTLMALVVKEDRKALEQALADSRTTGQICEAEFRLLRSTGEPLWVQDRLRVFLDEKGDEAVYHALADNSRDRALRAELEAELHRNRLIFEQMDGFPFELDMEQDRMIASPKWKSHFGYIPREENFLAELSHSHFHPDDLEALRAMLRRLEEGAPESSTELRLINNEGHYIWCSFGGSGIYNEAGKLVRVIGLITDIDLQKRTQLELKEQAERDPLTRLLNRNSARLLISEHLLLAKENALNALLLLDLDNFKAVNDSYGHLYGDAVLTQISAALRRLFRPSDIISRIGGDEFLVLMKDIPSPEMVETRCQLLLDVFRQEMEQLIPDLPCSCSIGVAVAPLHGTGYGELFQHADEALYLAKNGGKNTYRLYSDNLAMDRLRMEEHTLTRIDSDDHPGMADSSFLRFVFRRLYESRDLERTIEEILAFVGQQLNVSRVYIFENNEDNTTCSNTFEWCNDGVEPQIDLLQNVSYIEDIAGWPELFNERGVFYCTDISSLQPHFRAILEPQGIKSMLQCSILDNGAFRGYVGFDECTVNRVWREEHIALLEFLSEILALFLLKQRSQDKTRRQAENLTAILNSQDDWIYVVEPETLTLRFLNEQLRRLAPDSTPGQPCYQALTGRDTPCENCPVAELLRTGKASTTTVENRRCALAVRATAGNLHWNGSNAVLVTCREESTL